MTSLPCPQTEESQTLYRFYDANGVLLYVGITNDPGARWAHHARNKDWWQMVSRIEVEHFDSRSLVAEAEKSAIIAERPVHNFNHNANGLPDPYETDLLPTEPQHFKRRCESCGGLDLVDPSLKTWDDRALQVGYRCRRGHQWTVNWQDARFVIRDCACAWCNDPKRRRLEVVGRHWF